MLASVTAVQIKAAWAVKSWLRPGKLLKVLSFLSRSSPLPHWMSGRQIVLEAFSSHGPGAWGHVVLAPRGCVSPMLAHLFRLCVTGFSPWGVLIQKMLHLQYRQAFLCLYCKWRYTRCTYAIILWHGHLLPNHNVVGVFLIFWFVVGFGLIFFFKWV